MKRFSTFCAGLLLAGGVLLLNAGTASAAPQLGYRLARAIAGPISPTSVPRTAMRDNGHQSAAAVAESQAAVESQPVAESQYAEAGPSGDNYDFSACCPSERFWLRADYLMWWTNGTRLPSLVTDGVLDNDGTNILYGDRVYGGDMRSGYRTTIGMWLGQCQTWGVEFDYLDLGQRDYNYSASSLGETTLARPFFDLLLNQQSYYTVADAQGFEGSVAVRAHDYFQSAGALLSYNIAGGAGCVGACEDECGAPMSCRRTDLLVGFRYYGLSDHVGVTQNTRYIETGDIYQLQDDFNARNEFYGSEIGFRTRMQRARWSLEVLTKVALGTTHETVTISGSSSLTPATGATLPFDGALLAVGSNSRTYEYDSFTMIPQLGVELGYQVNCHWRAFVGYNVLYWAAVRRAGDQIDLSIDLRNVPLTNDYDPSNATPNPTNLDRSSAFWAQGVNIGTEFRF